MVRFTLNFAQDGYIKDRQGMILNRIFFLNRLMKFLLKHRRSLAILFFLVFSVSMIGFAQIDQDLFGPYDQPPMAQGEKVQVVLKSGYITQGDLVESTDRYIRIKTMDLSVTYYLNEISSINGEPVVLRKSTVVSSQGNSRLFSGDIIEQFKRVFFLGDEGIVQSWFASLFDQEQLISVSQQSSDVIALKEDEHFFDSSNAQDPLITSTCPLRKRPAFVLSMSRFLSSAQGQEFNSRVLSGLVSAIIFYIYYSLCLFLMMKKKNKRSTWISWIPWINFFVAPLMIANISLAWLWLFFLMIVPIVNLFVLIFLIFFGVYVQCRMAMALNKPGWLGVVACLPVIGLLTFPVFYGYLAFSKD